MEHINNSVISLISIGVATTLLCETVGKGAFSSAIKTVCSLSILVALLGVFSPVFSTLSELVFTVPDEPPYDENNSLYNEAVITETVSNIEKYTKTMLVTSLGIQENDFDVYVTVDKNNPSDVRISEICIIFQKIPTVPVEIITDLVSRELMCSATVLLPNFQERIY